MLNPFVSITVAPDYKNGHFIQWEMDPFFHEPGPYCFTLQASEVESFTSTVFSKDVGDTAFAIDDSGSLDQLNDNFYYRVVLTDGNEVQYTSRVVGMGQISGGIHKYRQGAEVMRIEQVVGKFAAQAGWLLKRRNFGEVDTSAVSEISGAVISDNTTSFGTKFVGGYYDAIPISWRTMQTEEDRRLNPGGNGTDDTKTIAGRMIGYPKLSPQDVIVQKRTGRFFTVDTVKCTYIPGIGLCIVQLFEGLAIPPTDTIYSIDLPK
jgi:hypothetical protein